MKTLLLTVFTTISLFTHNKPDKCPGVEMLNGHWIYNSYEQRGKTRLFTYVRVRKFNKSKGGIAFYKGGRSRVRQNSSFCGTPPIVYKTYTGKWNLYSDSTLCIKHNYWGGKTNRVYRLISIQPDTLQFTVVE